MAVTLLRAYGGFAAGAVVTFPDATEQSLIAQGLAVASLITIVPSLVGGPNQYVSQNGNIAFVPQAGQGVPAQVQGPSILPNIPLGVAALAHLPETTIRLGGCLLLLVACTCLLANRRPNLPDGFALRFGTGLVAGFFAGASSLGGMVASVMLFAVALPAKNLRATLIVLFFGSALYSLSWGSWHGVVTQQTFTRAAWLALPLLAGIAVGSRGFRHVTEAGFRRAVLAVLAVLALAGAVSALWPA